MILILLLIFSFYHNTIQSSQAAPIYPVKLTQEGQPIPIESEAFVKKFFIAREIDDTIETMPTVLSDLIAEYIDDGSYLTQLMEINPQRTFKFETGKIYKNENKKWVLIKKCILFDSLRYSCLGKWTCDGKVYIEKRENFIAFWDTDNIDNPNTPFLEDPHIISLATHPTDNNIFACGTTKGSIIIYKKDQSNKWNKIAEKNNIHSASRTKNDIIYSPKRCYFNRMNPGHITNLKWSEKGKYLYATSYWLEEYSVPDKAGYFRPYSTINYGEIFKFKVEEIESAPQDDEEEKEEVE
jgi:hypothetical protein